MKQVRRTVFFLTAAIFSMFFIACGGGSSGSKPIDPPPTQYVTVPNIVGMTESAAETAITSVGLTVGTKKSENSPTVPSGNVISQSPVAGTSVIKSSIVTITISLGPEDPTQPVIVPNVIGMTESAAETAITSVGLTVGTTTGESSATIPLGGVISQNPPAGTPAEKSSSVSIVISLGPEDPTDPGDPTNPPPLDPSVDDIVLVEYETFSMGCTTEQGSDCRDDEKPAHQVALSDFYIAKYPVTQKQWREIMGTDLDDQCSKRMGRACVSTEIYGEGDNYPMYYVSWDDAQEFIERLNAKTGMNYRLPTEAEWEYAARGGNQSLSSFKYSGSNVPDVVAWYGEDQYNGGGTHPVGIKIANEIDIYDMSGNVWEWVSDWYGSNYYSSSPLTNPKGPESGDLCFYSQPLLGTGAGPCRVLRGGSWSKPAAAARVSTRYNVYPGARFADIGFRLARDAD